MSSLSEPQRSGAAGLTRYLPHAVVATAFVIMLPAVAVWVLAPSGGAMVSILSALVAMGLSVATASAASAFWMRRPGSRDVVFADLMLWGWLRRLRAERRLAEARRVLGLSQSDHDLRPVTIERRVAALKHLSALLEARDAETHGHARRVTRHAERIARAMHLSPSEVAKVRTAAALHDVGKILTPSEILNKPGALTEQEFELVKRHPLDGADMLAGIGDADVTAMVRHHHERLDGAGYPDGLVGEQIPLGARIIAVADTFDAMTSKRAYHGATNHKRALDVLSEEAGARLDADAVSAFLGYYSGRTSVAWSALATAAPQRLLGWLGSASERVGGGVAAVLPATGAAMVLVLPMPTEGSAARVVPPETRQRDASVQPDNTRPTAASTGRIDVASRAPRRAARTVPRARLAPRVRVRPRTPDGPGRSIPVERPAPAPGDATTPPAAPAPAPPSGSPSPSEPPPSGSPVPSLKLPQVRLPAVELPALPAPVPRLPPIVVPPVVVPEVTVSVDPLESVTGLLPAAP